MDIYWTRKYAESNCGQFNDTGVDCRGISYWMLIRKNDQDIRIFCDDELKFHLLTNSTSCRGAGDEIFFDADYASLKISFTRYCTACLNLKLGVASQAHSKCTLGFISGAEWTFFVQQLCQLPPNIILKAITSTIFIRTIYRVLSNHEFYNFID